MANMITAGCKDSITRDQVVDYDLMRQQSADVTRGLSVIRGGDARNLAAVRIMRGMS
jgi:hypothetical protein